MAEPGGTRALENSGNYTTERGGNDRAEMGWKLTTEPGWIKNGIRTEKTGRKCSQRDYPHEQLCSARRYARGSRSSAQRARARLIHFLESDLNSETSETARQTVHDRPSCWEKYCCSR